MWLIAHSSISIPDAGCFVKRFFQVFSISFSSSSAVSAMGWLRDGSASNSTVASATANTLWAPASSKACAQALLHAGADSVFALAFATVEFGAPPDDTTPICEDDEEDVYSDF